MKNPPHILIIGAGLIGLSTADSLIRRGAKVTVLDKRSGPGQGASFCNSGMIHPSQSTPWFEGGDPDATQHVLALARASRELLWARMQTLKITDVRRASGVVQLFDSLVMGEQARQHYAKLGIACEDATGEAFTFGRSALRFPDDRSGNAYRYCQALEAEILGRGGDIIYNVQETVDVRTFKADHMVIAAGADSAGVAGQYGINVPVKPLVGHALNFARPETDLPGTPVLHQNSHSTLTVFEDHVRLSGTINESDPMALLDIWEEIAPDIIERLGQPLSRWSGERPLCDYGRPIMSHSGQDNVWINAGHGHMGWTLSAGSGEFMARMMMEGFEAPEFGFLPQT